MTETTKRLDRFHRQLMLVTPASWKAATALGPLSARSSQLKAVGDELAAYHSAAAKTGGQYDTGLDLRVISLYYAIDHWRKTNQQERNSAQPNDWKSSVRNKHGVITKLFDLAFEYSIMVIGTSTAALPRTEREAFKLIEDTAKTAFVTLFSGAKMVIKSSYKRELTAQITVGAVTASGVVDRVMSSDAATKAADFVNKLVDAIKAYYNSGGGDVTLIRQIVNAMGVANDFFQSCLETVAKAIGKALSSIPGIAFLVDASTAASSFYAALSAHLKVLGGDRARYLVRPGAVDDAYNTIVQFWRDHRKTNLKKGAKSLAKALIKGVAAACSFGVSSAVEAVANVAEKVYSACTAIWDFITDVVKMLIEYNDINEGLARLGKEDYSANKLFAISPLLACYYFVSIPTSNIIRFQTSMMAMKGAKDVVEAAVARLAPAIEAAGEYIGESKFMFVTKAGRLFPVKCDLKNPSLLGQIKAAMKEGADGLLGDLVPEMPEIVITT